MAESKEKKELRLRKEAAVGQILAKERTMTEIAEEWEISRQAVGNWVARFKERGSLEPRKRGPKKHQSLTEQERRRFAERVLALYLERGLRPGDEISRAACIPPEALVEVLGEIGGAKTTLARTRGLMEGLRLPLYRLSPEEEEEELRWAEQDRELFGEGWNEDLGVPILRDPFAEQAPQAESDNLPEDDEPRTMEEYERWVAETRAALAKKGLRYDPETLGKEKPGPRPRPGVRQGKHAKGNRDQRPKKRKKRPKRSKRK